MSKSAGRKLMRKAARRAALYGQPIDDVAKRLARRERPKKRGD